MSPNPETLLSYDDLPAPERRVADFLSNAFREAILAQTFWREEGTIRASFVWAFHEVNGVQYPRSSYKFDLTSLVLQQREGLADEDLVPPHMRLSPVEVKRPHWWLCLVCRRASLGPEWDTPEHPVQRPQGFGLPSGGCCPYDGCQAQIHQGLSWPIIKRFEPDLPEQPERDVVYPRTRDYCYALVS